MTALADLQHWRETKSSGDEGGKETQREGDEGDFRGNKVEQEGQQKINEVLIELRERGLSFLELHSCKKYGRDLICCIITKDALSYLLPNGKKPRNHVTMTAATSLWRIFSIINDCRTKTKSNLGIIDGDIRMWAQS